jgi:hypothetical protein
MYEDRTISQISRFSLVGEDLPINGDSGEKSPRREMGGWWAAVLLNVSDDEYLGGAFYASNPDVSSIISIT